MSGCEHRSRMIGRDVLKMGSRSSKWVRKGASKYAPNSVMSFDSLRNFFISSSDTRTESTPESYGHWTQRIQVFQKHTCRNVHSRADTKWDNKHQKMRWKAKKIPIFVGKPLRQIAVRSPSAWAHRRLPALRRPCRTWPMGDAGSVNAQLCAATHNSVAVSMFGIVVTAFGTWLKHRPLSRSQPSPDFGKPQPWLACGSPHFHLFYSGRGGQ